MKISQKKLLLIAAKTNGRCFYCNKIGEVVDHFISKREWINELCSQDYPEGFPEELKGLIREEDCNRMNNLVLACVRCNSSKSDTNPAIFMGNQYKATSRMDRANNRIKPELLFL